MCNSPATPVGTGFIAASSTFARGNENNRHQPDGTYYLGPGTSDAYGVVNLGVRYRLTKQLELTGQVNNLFDHHYSSAAQLGPTGFTDTGNFIARPLPPIGGEFRTQLAALARQVAGMPPEKTAKGGVSSMLSFFAKPSGSAKPPALPKPPALTKPPVVRV